MSGTVDSSHKEFDKKIFGFLIGIIVLKTAFTIIIDNSLSLIGEVEEDTEKINKVSEFIKNEKGRPEAEQGKHDDLIMGLAITYYIRTQQSFIVKKIEKEEKIELPFALQTDDVESDDIIGW